MHDLLMNDIEAFESSSLNLDDVQNLEEEYYEGNIVQETTGDDVGKLFNEAQDTILKNFAKFNFFFQEARALECYEEVQQPRKDKEDWLLLYLDPNELQILNSYIIATGEEAENNKVPESSQLLSQTGDVPVPQMNVELSPSSIPNEAIQREAQEKIKNEICPSLEHGLSHRPTLKQARGRKPIFTERDNKKIIELVAEFGDKDWSKIAKKMRKFNRKQIREQYIHYIKQSGNLSEFTQEEDKKLLTLIKQYGRQWESIARYMPDRNSTNLKNRYSTLKRLGYNVDLDEKK